MSFSNHDTNMTGLVLRSTGSWYSVLPMDDGAVASLANAIDCRLRGNYRLRGNKQTNPVAVGDVVDCTIATDGTGIIHEVHDRRNYIIRKATKLSKQTHVIAANIDLLCIVATVDFPRTSTGFIDRLLVTAEAYRIPACIILNKTDRYLHDDTHPLTAIHHHYRQTYQTIGYPVYSTSALQGDGIEQLRKVLEGKTILFCGHSGVGKSALLATLVPGLEVRVGEVSDWSLKGRHTTTFAQLYPIQLHQGGKTTFLADTPGIKEFGMVDINSNELSHFFPEMRRVLHDCHFSNCTHRHEPGCAVREDVERGFISKERYNSYLSIFENCKTPV